MGAGLLSAIAERPVGSRVAVVYDPADPRRVEHGMGACYGAIALVSAAVSLAIFAPFGLAMAAALLEYVVFR
jgi:hypothetical protein